MLFKKALLNGPGAFLSSHTLLDPKDPIPKLRTTCCRGKSQDQDTRVGQLVLLASCVFEQLNPLCLNLSLQEMRVIIQIVLQGEAV